MIFKICWVKKSKAYRKSSILKTYTSKCLYMHKTFPEGNEKLLAIFDYRKGIDIWDKMEFSSVQFSCSVMSDSLRPHELQHARPPCLSPTPRVHSNSFHRVSDAIQPSHPVIPFSSCPQSLPASESFPMSQLFTWGGQSTGVLPDGDWRLPLNYIHFVMFDCFSCSHIIYSTKDLLEGTQSHLYYALN